jgi:hypothetical protein
MGSHIAIAEPPFGGRVRKTYTIFAGREILGLLAAVTLFYYLIACPSTELTSIAVHEETLDSLFNACTNHGYHILSVLILKSFLLNRYIKIVKIKIRIFPKRVRQWSGFKGGN